MSKKLDQPVRLNYRAPTLNIPVSTKGNKSNKSPGTSSAQSLSPHMAVASSPRSPVHAIRNEAPPERRTAQNMFERFHEENLAKVMENAETERKNHESDNRYKADHIRADNERKLVDDYIKQNDLDRQERKEFLELFKLGIYYADKGKIKCDSEKLRAWNYMKNSNNEFDEETKRRAYRKYDKKRRQIYGFDHGHDDPKMINLRKKIEDDYKRKREKKRAKFLKKKFKKYVRAKKWKDKFKLF